LEAWFGIIQTKKTKTHLVVFKKGFPEGMPGKEDCA
jgi:hypothetical protein